MQKIAILVDERFSGANTHADDLLLKKSLEEKGYQADVVVWSDKEVDFSVYALAIIRSCWGYDERVDEFLARLSEISSKTKLANPYDMVCKNSDKRYLQDLEKRGIKIIPMKIVESADDVSFPLEWEKVVIKPTVSASGKDTFRFDSSDENEIKHAVKSILDKGKAVILQRYVEAIEVNGERSTTVINGESCFTMKKTPAKGEFLVHNDRGGTYQKTDMTSRQENFVKDVLDKIGETPLYVRIDYIEDFDGKIYLLELEEIEPYLYLTENKRGLELLLKGVEERIK